ncbi:hypothetical protein A0H81_13062 [Grifola frondosa]|uniref:Uncharacterized protein n=1 Tax=Grifola frondosa TaxID=5627 RepID=A0A1C7LQC4_GRIFR|nr:hypothetical protein A0H81_13062 [Grifola frondosa]
MSALYNVEANRIILVGYYLGCVGYGISATLFVLCFRALYQRVRENRTSAMLMGYICTMFLLSSLGNAFEIEGSTIGFITYWNYPGGFYQSDIPLSDTWRFNATDIIYIVSSVLQDSLLLYRFWIIYSGNLIALFLPTLMFVATTIGSCVFIATFTRPGSSFLERSSVSVGLIQVSISIAFNVLVTAMIVVRLLLMRRHLRGLMGSSAAMPYVSVMAILIESAFIYTAFGIVAVAAYGIGIPLSTLFLPLFGQITSIAPFLIILRMAEGRAWSNDTVAITNTTSTRFTTIMWEPEQQNVPTSDAGMIELTEHSHRSRRLIVTIHRTFLAVLRDAAESGFTKGSMATAKTTTVRFATARNRRTVPVVLQTVWVLLEESTESAEEMTISERSKDAASHWQVETGQLSCVDYRHEVSGS